MTGRGGGTRTHDLLYPKQARYQAAPRPDHGERPDPMGGSVPMQAYWRRVYGALPKIRCSTVSPTRISSLAVVPAGSSSVARTGPRLSITARLRGVVSSAIER